MIEAAGFRRLKESDPASSAKAGGHYNSAVNSRINHKGRIPNVIRAYYAVYVPDPAFKMPKKAESSIFSFHSNGDVGKIGTDMATSLAESKSP